MPLLKWSQVLDNSLTAFVYHEVSDCPSPFAREFGLNVSIHTFRRQVAWIKDNFSVIHPRHLHENAPMPRRAALITFDDGFLGTFKNGLEVLLEERLPSIVFLNMQPILERKPIFSAIACYLNRYVPEFASFAETLSIKDPFHLTLDPKTFKQFEARYGRIDLNAVLDYQGFLADLTELRKWNDNCLVTYGNHLFDHWNSQALNLDEFSDQYRRNEEALSRFRNSLPLFAFTNGQPGTCYSTAHVSCLAGLGSKRVFSSSSGLNRNPQEYLLDRICLGDRDREESHFCFHVIRGLWRTGRNLRSLT